MTPTTLRIDSRLVHGQVVEAWLPALKADRVVIVDDAAAESQLTRAAMRLALPPEITLTVVGPDEAGLEILDGEHRPLILVPDIQTALRLVDRLDSSAADLLINVGVVHHAENRRPITPSVHLSQEELDMLSGLSARGIAVEVRGLPSHPPISVERARESFEKCSRKSSES